MQRQLRYLALVFIVFCAAYGPTADAARPNVVLIMTDDLGYRELGCYGQEKIKTQNIDRLAAEGMRMTQHYCGNAVCAPSRCSLMTGKHPGHAFIRSNREIKPEGQLAIPPGEVTLAELLKQRGYVCGAFGKWGLGAPGSTGDPLHQGFDRFFGNMLDELGDELPDHSNRMKTQCQHARQSAKSHRRNK